MPTIATTIISSINVNPCCFFFIHRRMKNSLQRLLLSFVSYENLVGHRKPEYVSHRARRAVQVGLGGNGEPVGAWIVDRRAGAVDGDIGVEVERAAVGDRRVTEKQRTIDMDRQRIPDRGGRA